MRARVGVLAWVGARGVGYGIKTHIHSHTHALTQGCLCNSFCELIDPFDPNEEQQGESKAAAFLSDGSRKLSLAMRVEEQVKTAAHMKRVLTGVNQSLADMREREMEAGEAAVGVFGHAMEDVASNGVLAFLSAFDEQGLHSRSDAWRWVGCWDVRGGE